MRRTASVLISAMLMLIAIGIVMLASTSASEASARYHDAYYFLRKQCIYLALGMVAMTVCCFLDYRKWQRYYWFIGAVSFGLLIVVLSPHIGVSINGSRRWLRLGPMTVQPSEVGKFAVLVVMAWWMAKNAAQSESFWRGFVVPGLIMAAFAGPIAKEPDYGTTMLCACGALTVMFAGGTRISYLLFTSLAGAIGMSYMLLHNANRFVRILAYLNPEKYAREAAYQLINAQFAFVCGGGTGVGLGRSFQKEAYLPEAHTDFIFPIIGEELGLVATLSVIGLFITIFICGLLISRKAPDTFGRLLAFGITTVLTLQAAFNVAVVTGCVPTKGLPLPFISYGGTSLVVSMVMVGVLVSIARHAAIEESSRIEAIKDRARWV